MYYGSTIASHIDAIGQGGKALLWALCKVEDTCGNYYTVEYEEDTVNGDYYPKRIKYTQGNGLTVFRTVDFSYDNRADVVPLYIPTLVKMDRRMRFISIKNGVTNTQAGNLIRKYEIKYQNTNGTSS